MDACILACLVLLFAVMIRLKASFQEESSFVSFVMRLTTAPLHKIHVKPHLVMAALIRLSDAKGFVGGMGNAPCCRTLQRSLESGGLRNPHTSDHAPGTAPGPHNGLGPGAIGKSVGEGFFDDTQSIGAGGASPSSPVESSSNHVYMFLKHNSANSKE